MRLWDRLLREIDIQYSGIRIRTSLEHILGFVYNASMIKSMQLSPKESSTVSKTKERRQKTQTRKRKTVTDSSSDSFHDSSHEDFSEDDSYEPSRYGASVSSVTKSTESSSKRRKIEPTSSTPISPPIHSSSHISVSDTKRFFRFAQFKHSYQKIR